MQHSGWFWYSNFSATKTTTHSAVFSICVIFQLTFDIIFPARNSETPTNTGNAKRRFKNLHITSSAKTQFCCSDSWHRHAIFFLLTRSTRLDTQRFVQICSFWHTDLRAASKLLHNKIPVATQVSWQVGYCCCCCCCCASLSLHELWQINVMCDKMMMMMLITKLFPLHVAWMWCGRQLGSWAVGYVLCCFRLTDLITGLYCRKVSIASEGNVRIYLYENKKCCTKVVQKILFLYIQMFEKYLQWGI